MRTSTGSSSLTRRQEQLAWISLLLCLCLLVADRWLILHQFGFRYVDDDQAIMWNGAEEMAHGRFHEPCFYGQRYNTMLEGLVAVPLLWSGVEHEVALPLMTGVLALLPFMICSGTGPQAGTGPCGVQYSASRCRPVRRSDRLRTRGFPDAASSSALAVLPLFTRRDVWLFLSRSVPLLFPDLNAALVLAPAWLPHLLENIPTAGSISRRGRRAAAAMLYLGHLFTKCAPFTSAFPWGSASDREHPLGRSGFLDEVTPFLWKGMVRVHPHGRAGGAPGMASNGPAVALLFGVVLLVAIVRGEQGPRWHPRRILSVGKDVLPPFLALLPRYGSRASPGRPSAGRSRQLRSVPCTAFRHQKG